MRHYLYTCCRCGRELRTDINCEDAPLGWALVTYQRETVAATEHQSLETHACGGCSPEVLAFLEKASRDVDSAFDDGGAA